MQPGQQAKEFPMTDIAVRPDSQLDVNTGQDVSPGQDAAIARLASWAETARAAYDIAVMLVKTTFVPAQYRDKPHEAAAAIMAGAELGIPGPIGAMKAFHPINGTPSLAALAMRGIVQSHGHQVPIRFSDATRAEVAGRRKGETDWHTSVWTIERATEAGLVGGKNPNWKTNPTAMLVARATSEVCRWVASDALMGMPYSAEELQDQGEQVAAPVPAARRLTTADLDEPPADRPGARIHPADGRKITPGYMADPDAARKAAEFPGYVDPSTLVVPDPDWPEPAVPGGAEQ
jgi:hypothetical protein